jgi:hypothetical protein
MSNVRIISIFVGVAVAFGIGYGLNARWYVSLSLGLLGYLVVRYFGWVINERQRFRKEFDRVVATQRPPDAS